MTRPWMANHSDDRLAKKEAMAFLWETVALMHFGLWISPTRLCLKEPHHMKTCTARVGGCE